MLIFLKLYNFHLEPFFFVSTRLHNFHSFLVVQLLFRLSLSFVLVKVCRFHSGLLLPSDYTTFVQSLFSHLSWSNCTDSVQFSTFPRPYRFRLGMSCFAFKFVSELCKYSLCSLLELYVSPLFSCLLLFSNDIHISLILVVDGPWLLRIRYPFYQSECNNFAITLRSFSTTPSAVTKHAIFIKSDAEHEDLKNEFCSAFVAKFSIIMEQKL